MPNWTPVSKPQFIMWLCATILRKNWIVDVFFFRRFRCRSWHSSIMTIVITIVVIAIVVMNIRYSWTKNEWRSIWNLLLFHLCLTMSNVDANVDLCAMRISTSIPIKFHVLRTFYANKTYHSYADCRNMFISESDITIRNDVRSNEQYHQEILLKENILNGCSKFILMIWSKSRMMRIWSFDDLIRNNLFTIFCTWSAYTIHSAKYACRVSSEHTSFKIWAHVCISYE